MHHASHHRQAGIHSWFKLQALSIGQSILSPEPLLVFQGLMEIVDQFQWSVLASVDVWNGNLTGRVAGVWHKCTKVQNLRIKQVMKSHQRGDAAELTFTVQKKLNYKYKLEHCALQAGMAVLSPKCNPNAPKVVLKPLKVLPVAVTTDGENIFCDIAECECEGPGEPFPLIEVRGWTWARLRKEIQEFTGTPAVELLYAGSPVQNRRQIGGTLGPQ